MSSLPIANARSRPSNEPSLASSRPPLARQHPKSPPAAVVIGASTGGPQALDIVLQGLLPILPHVPIFVVLHMPAEFTDVIANHIRRLTGAPARAASHGEPVCKGHIYFAPGGIHMGIASEKTGMTILHANDPPENYCRPAVDFLFRAASRCYGARTLGIVLTGMGQDGLAGSRSIVEAGGTIIAQDEASSVVWGMPGSVVMAGLASAVLPVTTIAGKVRELMRTGFENRGTSV